MRRLRNLILYMDRVSQSKKMEDFILLKTKCQRVIGDGVSTYLVFGLFDRHNGFAATLYSKENLLNDVLAAIPPELSKDEWVAVLPRTSVAGFVETDMDFKEEAQTSGITITFVTIEGWVVIVASIGDSRCIFESAEGDIYHLSANHRFECDEEERDCVVAREVLIVWKNHHPGFSP